MATVTNFDLDSTTSGSNGAASYSEGTAAVRLAQSATVSATGNFNGQTLTISGLLAEDQIGFASGVTVSGSSILVSDITIGTFTGGTGGSNLVFTFNSNATAGRVQTLIRNLTFLDNSEFPTVNQTLTFDLAGTVRTEAVTVTPVNDAPVIDLNGAASGTAVTLAYTENQPLKVIAPSATVGDIDSLNFDTGSLTVSFTSNGSSADQLGIATDATVTVSNGTVLVGATAVGTLSGGANGTNLVVSFNGAATAALITTLVQHIGYASTSDNPATAARQVSFSINDGDGTANGGVATAAATATINVTRVNDAPVVDLNGAASETSTTLGYVLGAPLTAIAPSATVSDIDSTNFSGGSLRVAFTQNGTTSDRLGIITDAVVTLTGTSGATVRVSGTSIGTVSGGANGTDLVVTFNGNSTPARVQTLLQHIGYTNASADPSVLDRSVAFSINDGDGTANGGRNTGLALATINFPGAADTQPPTVTVSAASPTVNAGQTDTITFTFSEAVSGFDNADVSVTGGTLGAITATADPKVYTAIFTPTTDVDTQTASIQVLASGTGSSAWADAADNPGSASNVVSITEDTKAPGVTVGASASSLKTGETATITFTFSEAVSGFNNADVSVTGGTLGAIAAMADPKVYSATFTPAAGVEGQASIQVLASGTGTSTWTDTLGNGGAVSNLLAIAEDTSPPTAAVAITDIDQDTGTPGDFKTSATTLTVFGTNGALGDGETVQINSDGVTWVAATVIDGTHWSYADPATHDANFTYRVRVVDSVGNVGNSASQDITIDTAAPSVVVSISDSELNASESAIVTFAFSEAPVGFTLDAISATGGAIGDLQQVDATHYTAVFTPAGSLETAAAVSVAAGSYSDAQGNSGSAGSTDAFIVDTIAPTIAIDTITGDDVINTAEANSGFVVSGTVSDVEDGQSVTVHIVDGANAVVDNTYTASVVAGAWSLAVPSGDIGALANGEYTVTTAVSDHAGNAATVASRALTLDNQAPTVTVTISDSLVNAGETATVTFTFSVAPVGFALESVATVGGSLSSLQQVDDTNYTATFTPTAGTETVAAKVSVPAGSYADSEGNPGAAGSTGDFTVDTISPTISIGTVAGDDAVNASEAAAGFAIGGTTTGVETGQHATIALNGHAYDAVVTADAWSVNVSAADATALAEGAATITADVSDLAGNVAPQGSRSITVDRLAPTIAIAALAGDNIVNASEAGTGFTISGTTTGVEDGRHVVVVLNGRAYDSVVLADAWSVNVPGADTSVLPDGAPTITANVSDLAGNPALQTTRSITVDKTAPTIAIGVITGDDAVSSSEASSGFAISGTTTGAESGRHATIVLNGHGYDAVVTSNAWSVTVPSSDAMALASGSYVVTANISDDAGNAAIQASRTISVGAPASLSFATATTGKVVNLTTHVWADAVTVLPVGDSITFGIDDSAGTADANLVAYRAALFQAMTSNNLLIDFVGDQNNGTRALPDRANAGVPGRTADQLLVDMPSYLNTYHPSVMLLLIGTNDFGEEDVTGQQRAILDLVHQQSPNTKILIGALPPIPPTTPLGPEAPDFIYWVNLFMPAMVAQARADGIDVSLVTWPSVGYDDLNSDGVHPTAAGYAEMAQYWFEALVSTFTTTNGTLGGASNAIAGNVTTVTGGSGGDFLIGDANANTLSGGAGNDQLRGEGGADTLTGGTGADWFIFDGPTGAVTVITDFDTSNDMLVFSASGFPGLTAGVVPTIRTGSTTPAASGTAPQFLYNTTTGALLWDDDGTGTHAAQQIATLGSSTHPTIGTDDFLVIRGSNDAPVEMFPISAQNASVGLPFSYVTPATVFADPDNDLLTLTATLAGGGALPSWLSFNAQTYTFSGTPAAANLGTLSVQLTATDPFGATASEVFSLTVWNQPPVTGAGATVTGTTGNDTLTFTYTSLTQASLANVRLVNPYDGTEAFLTTAMRANNAHYDGLGGTDTLNMTTSADYLSVDIVNGTPTLQNIERVLAGNGNDSLILASSTVQLGALYIDGGAGNNTIWGNVGNDTILASSGDNVLNGGPGADTITAGTGNDLLLGGAGADVLTGGSGFDGFVFANPTDGPDTVTDFRTDDGDLIYINAAGFGLTPGEAAPFVAAAAPTAAAASFLYATTTGNLFWDADGSGGQSPTLIAVLTGAPDLHVHNLVLT
jgi:lysophospholipase L1-like esterase